MRKESIISEALHDAILAGLDLFPIAFLVLDRGGRTLAANRAARRVIQHGRTVIKLVDHVPALQSRQLNKIFQDLIGPSSYGARRTPAALAVPRSGGKPLSIVVVPVKNVASEDLTVPGSVVLLGDPELLPTPDPMLLSSLFGFTPAESKVASMVMQGKTVEEVGIGLGISPHTTRNHLKRLFAKTNTKRQGELVHMLLSSPACLDFG